MTFKVMSWNVESYFRPDARDVEGRRAYTRKVAALAPIARLDPDVVALH